ncbi:MAG: hypothetical protein ACFB0C_07325 [Leptolyngbyaceae cyanobacterium]
MTDSKVPLLELPASEGDPNQLAELYADRLMDDLFTGVEQALDGDAKALNELNIPLAEPTTPDIADGTNSSLAPTIDVAATVANALPNLTYALTTDAAPAPQQPKPRRPWLLIPLVLGAAGVSVATALLLGWLSQRQATPEAVVTPAPAADAVATTPDAEFLEYLRRSLEVISQDAGTAAGTPGVPEVSVALNGSSLGLPPINSTALPAGAATGPNGVPQINVIERVYIPYQAGQPVAGAPTTATGAPTTATGAPTAAPASRHVLVGILELGNRSAALFEIEGIPQRVYIGERIGNSGWSLVAVANGEATIRRNGEVRSIFIGQQF